MTDKPARRPLLNTLHNPDDILAEAQRLADAQRDHRLTMLGQWTLAQNIEHIARLMHSSVNGFSVSFPPPLRWFMRTFMKKRALTSLPPSGIPLFGAVRDALVPEPDITTDQALQNLARAVEQSNNTDTRYPSPLLGELSIDQWNAFQARHAEHHFSLAIIHD